MPIQCGAGRDIRNARIAATVEPANQCDRAVAVAQFQPGIGRAQTTQARQFQCRNFSAFDRFGVPRRGELGDPELSFALDIGFRPRATQRTGGAGEIARLLFGAARILFEALRQPAQAFKLDQPGNGRAEIGQRFPVFAEQAQCPLSSAIV